MSDLASSSWLAALIGAVAAVLVSVVSSLLSKRTAEADDDQKSYDQLQEDNNALRGELAAMRADAATGTASTRAELTELRDKLERVNDGRLSDRAAALRENTGLWRLVHSLEEEISMLRNSLAAAGGVLPPRPERRDPELFGSGK